METQATRSGNAGTLSDSSSIVAGGAKAYLPVEDNADVHQNSPFLGL